MKAKSSYHKATVIVSTLLIFFAFGFNIPDQSDDDWNVPESFKRLKNPVPFDDEVLNIGISYYSKHCKSCHGKNGEGDGPKAEELDTFPGDLTSNEVQRQTDGELFYKTTKGREDMPGFEKKLSDEDRWILVHFIRSLKK